MTARTITETELLDQLDSHDVTVDEALELVKSGAAKLDPRSKEPGNTWESQERRGWETSELGSVLWRLGQRDRLSEFNAYRQ